MEELKNTEPITETAYGTAFSDAKAAQEQTPAAAPKPKKTFKDFMNWLDRKLTRKKASTLILQIFLILIVIPEAFLMLCGLIFDKWLKLYELTTVIFIVWAIVLIIAIILTVKSIICYSREKKKRKK